MLNKMAIIFNSNYITSSNGFVYFFLYVNNNNILDTKNKVFFFIKTFSQIYILRIIRHFRDSKKKRHIAINCSYNQYLNKITIFSSNCWQNSICLNEMPSSRPMNQLNWNYKIETSYWKHIKTSSKELIGTRSGRDYHWFLHESEWYKTQEIQT